MKEIYSKKHEIQDFLSPKDSIFDEVGLEINYDSNLSYDEVTKEKAQDVVLPENNSQPKSRKEEEMFLINKLKSFSAGEFRTDDFPKLPRNEQLKRMRDYLTSEDDGFTNYFKNLPDFMIELLAGTTIDGDCGRNSDDKPDWLDLEKFKKGQKFATDYAFGVSYAQLLSLFILFSFEDGLKPLILTGKSSTPYTAFKRYLSTGLRVRNWFTEDPWTKGTAAHNDIQTVRKLHAAVKNKLLTTDEKEISAACKIENLYCPTSNLLVEDFHSTCPAPAIGQCPFLFLKYPEFKSLPLQPKRLSQTDMSLTQFGFMGLVILYPKWFGIHAATEEDFEAFCHMWRGIGYLLGIEDEFNFCRGTLTEIKQRSRDFLQVWVIPNFRELTPECEHMLRCAIEGLQYYLPGSTYESCVLYLTEMLNLHTPRLYSSLTYRSWIRHILLRTYFQYTCQVPGIMRFMNKRVNTALDKAVKFTGEKHEELKKRSEETLKRTIES